MAEGYFRKYAPDGFLAISVGTKPATELNPLAVEAMRDADIDISHQKSMVITEDMMRNSTKIVNMDAWTRNLVLLHSYII
jgi:protein-tyrosine-phosphatase